MIYLKKIFKSKNERKVAKEKNAKIDEKKKEDASKAQVIFLPMMKYINKLLIFINKTNKLYFFLFILFFLNFLQYCYYKEIFIHISFY